MMYKKFVIAGLFFISVTGLQASNAIPKYNEIPVVKTWSELREAPVFAKGDFGIVRLGMEAKQCSQGSGVLLYALVERGGSLSGSLYYDHPNALGPLVCNCESEVSEANGLFLQEARLKLSENVDFVTKSNEVLYTRVAMVQTKDRQIKIQSPTGKTVTASIQRTNETFEPWSSLSLASLVKAGVESGEIYEMRIGLQSMTQATPIHNGVDAQYIDMTPAGEQALPKLWPSNSSKTLKLVAKDGELLLRSDSSIELSSLEENLLARWWVNGEFISPKAATVPMLKERTGKMIDANQLRIVLDLNLFQGSVKKGDRIGLQLLYVPQGWAIAGVPPKRMHWFSRPKQSASSLRMTARVDFTLN